MINYYRRYGAPICIICKTNPYNGLNGGILINSKLICTTCEANILQVPQGEQYYADFKEELKALWC